MLIKDPQPNFLNHALLRKPLREMMMTQAGYPAIVNTHAADVRQACS
jgi:hypothetical protein